MHYNSTNSALNQYQQVKVQTGVHGADPHRLIEMMLDGAMERIIAAKTHMQQGNPAQKGQLISGAISIIDGLRASLDMEKGGDIAENLEGLYDYMGHQLLTANVNNETALLDETAGLLREIKEAWHGIGETARESGKYENPEVPTKGISIGA